MKSSMTDVHPLCILFKEKPSITDVHLFCFGVKGKHQSSTERKNHPLHKFIHLASELEGKISHPLKPPCRGEIIHYKSSSIPSVSNEKHHPSILGVWKGEISAKERKQGFVCVCVSCLRDRRAGTCPWRWWSGALAILQ